MANVVLLGTDPTLLEGLAQTLAASGHSPNLLDDGADLLAVARAEGPTILVAERALLLAPAVAERLPATIGANALIAYHTGETPDSGAPTALPQRLHRLVLADLCLPLERQRLVALIGCVEDLAERAGRGQRSDSDEPELRA